MKITFDGAAQTVTGTQHLLEVNGCKILLDCGLYQGKRKDTFERNENFPFKPAELDALVLSHAHIDHSGNIPNLVKSGYRGPIYATEATRDLCNYMLRDSGRIQEADAEFVNKLALKRGQPQDAVPLYTEEDAIACLKYFKGYRYGQAFIVAPGVTVTFYDAGHILGSAMVVLDVNEDGRRYRLAFSGDIGRKNLPILRDPSYLHGVDYLIMESTYGSRVHRPPEEAFVEFRSLVKDAIARRGKIIVPSFAVGRAQELIYDLQKLIMAKEIKPLPVYVDSPLASEVTGVFRQHRELFDDEMQGMLRATNGEILLFSSLKYTQTVEESKAINDQEGPLVIISASGMCESGRIRHHLANNIGDPKNTILIVSWQAPETLGRRLADHEKEVRIFGEPYKVRARVATINGYSGHAGQDALVQWAAAMKPQVKKVFIVHGELASSNTLSDLLKQEGLTTYVPQLHESVEI
jgi:metallo-beta-lactamase family protein